MLWCSHPTPLTHSLSLRSSLLSALDLVPSSSPVFAGVLHEAIKQVVTVLCPKHGPHRPSPPSPAPCFTQLFLICRCAWEKCVQCEWMSTVWEPCCRNVALTTNLLSKNEIIAWGVRHWCKLLAFMRMYHSWLLTWESESWNDSPAPMFLNALFQLWAVRCCVAG